MVKRSLQRDRIKVSARLTGWLMIDEENHNAEQVYFKLFDKSRCSPEIFSYIYINLLLQPMFFIALMMSLIIAVWSQRPFCSVTMSPALVSALTWLYDQIKSSWDLSRKQLLKKSWGYRWSCSALLMVIDGDRKLEAKRLITHLPGNPR